MINSTILTGDWRRTLESVVGSATDRLTLCAPFVSRSGTDLVRQARTGKPSDLLNVLILTDLSPLPVCAGATDPVAVASLATFFGRAQAVHLPRLHAKVYAADGQRAIVTSGNLTGGGLNANHECGLLVQDQFLAGRIEQEVTGFAGLGAVLDKVTLDHLCDLAEDARRAYRAQMASVSKESTRKLSVTLRKASDTLIRARLAEGPVHAVFARTIEFLLSRHGPLTTKQIHPLIQQMHPDLCDDTVDRVIDGKRFGKK